MDPPTPPDQREIETIRELARGFWYSAILRAAIKLDVFSILDGVALTAEELAGRISGATGYVRAFLEACEVLSLVERHGDRFTNSAVTSKYLVSGREGYIGDHALHHTNTWMSWGRLDEVVREGKTLLPFETGYIDEAAYWTNYMVGQNNRATSGQAYHLVNSVDLKGKRKLIDLGGGAASYSIALCQANPELRSVVVDRREPLAIARSMVEKHRLQDRITLMAGDFFDADLGADYDAVLISGVILIKSEADSRGLFQLAYDLLTPGGMIIVQDYMRIDRTPEQARVDVLENLYVKVVFDPGAGDRDGEEVASWLRGSGFTNLRLTPLPTQLALVTAEKPSGS